MTASAKKQLLGLATGTANHPFLSLAEIVRRLRTRTRGIDQWLQQVDNTCKIDQRHCEEGTVERAYWHYGYMVALRDVLDLLESAMPPTN